MIDDFIAFYDRVGLLLEPDLIDRGIKLEPNSFFGDFGQEQVDEVLVFLRNNPEYHVVTCIEGCVYVNGFVANAPLYILADGDPDPALTHDPDGILDLPLLQSLNSARSKSKA